LNNNLNHNRHYNKRVPVDFSNVQVVIKDY